MAHHKADLTKPPRPQRGWTGLFPDPLRHRAWPAPTRLSAPDDLAGTPRRAVPADPTVVRVPLLPRRTEKKKAETGRESTRPKALIARRPGRSEVGFRTSGTYVGAPNLGVRRGTAPGCLGEFRRTVRTIGARRGPILGGACAMPAPLHRSLGDAVKIPCRGARGADQTTRNRWRPAFGGAVSCPLP